MFAYCLQFHAPNPDLCGMMFSVKLLVNHLAGPPDLRRAHSKSSLTEEMQRWNAVHKRSLKWCFFLNLFDMIRPYSTFLIVNWRLPFSYWWKEPELIEVFSMFLGISLFCFCVSIVLWRQMFHCICEPIINIVLKLSELSGAPNAFRERGQGTLPLTTWQKEVNNFNAPNGLIFRMSSCSMMFYHNRCTCKDWLLSFPYQLYNMLHSKKTVKHLGIFCPYFRWSHYWKPQKPRTEVIG